MSAASCSASPGLALAMSVPVAGGIATEGGVPRICAHLRKSLEILDPSHGWVTWTAESAETGRNLREQSRWGRHFGGSRNVGFFPSNQRVRTCYPLWRRLWRHLRKSEEISDRHFVRSRQGHVWRPCQIAPATGFLRTDLLRKLAAVEGSCGADMTPGRQDECVDLFRKLHEIGRF